MTLPPFPLEARAFALPLAAPFRGLSQRQGVVFRGTGGWGEFSPFADYSAEQDARWLAAALEAAVDPDQGDGSTVPVNAILADVADGELEPAVVELMTRTGCSTLKVKVGGRATGIELARVARIHACAADVVDSPRLRLDGNGRFDRAAAQEFLAALTWSDLGVEYVEQPCDSAGELRLLKQQFPQVPLAADEALRRERKFDDVSDFADVAIVKVAPLGGARFVRELVATLDVPAVVSGAAESSVGLGRDVVLAAGLDTPERAQGLGTGTLLADDLVARSLVPHNGGVTARRMPVADDAVERATARLSAAERGRWQDRLESAWSLALARDLVAVADLEALGVGA